LPDKDRFRFTHQHQTFHQGAYIMVFPEYRPRRLRRNETFRSLIRENRLSASQLIYPLFITHGKNKREEISSMPGVFRLSVDQLKKEAEE
jgi:porphobilinogen synthase